MTTRIETANSTYEIGSPLLPERFWAKVEAATSGCWEWTGAKTQGYGTLGGRGAGYAHRISYSAMVAPIPPGLHIDHLCRNRACVNPSHLEPVTQAENNRRAGAAKIACAQGHPFTPDNTHHMPDGTRRCKECNRLNARAQHAKRKDLR